MLDNATSDALCEFIKEFTGSNSNNVTHETNLADCGKGELLESYISNVKKAVIDDLVWLMMRPKNYEKPISQNKFTKDVSLSAFPCFASDGYSGIGIKKTAEAMADALHDILSVRHIDFRINMDSCLDKAENYNFSFLGKSSDLIFADGSRGYLQTWFPEATNDKELYICAAIAFIDIVEEMKTNPAKAKAIFKPNDMVYLKQDSKHRTGCNSDIRAILSTSGSKYKAFRNCIDLSAFANCKSLYELCARTAIGSLLYSDSFEYINCYDIDKKFPYFFEIISGYCDRMIFQTRAILRAYDIHYHKSFCR